MSATLRNAYVEKTATTERSCFICMKMTTKGEGFPPVPTAEALAAVAAIKKKKAEAERKKQETASASSTTAESEKKSSAAKLGSAVFSGIG
ncbi:hypothetical protein BGZ80_011287, partial [Entomortierella chlamydospora]